MKAGQTDEAVLQFQRALELTPESADIHNAYGSALARKGDLDQAMQEFSTAIKINPRLAEAHNNLGIALM
jgi:Flp pilus assembly protein TadD